MNKLLVTDTHLDENPDNEYRWDFFRHVRILVHDNNVSHIYHLGDLVDRKDRFPAFFVNRLIDEIEQTARVASFTILKGNHDTPLNGPAFFQFLNGRVMNVRYITEPTPDGDVLLLPFAADPMTAWMGLKYGDFRAAFLHVTITGAITETGYEIEHGTKLPILPRSLRIYSGDVHVPQQCRNITYVGCPHPIKFGDDFPCRMLLLDENYEIKKQFDLTPPRKRVIRVSSLEELRAAETCEGDSARIEFFLTARDVENYSFIEREIQTWASQRGVTVAGHEFKISEMSSGADLDLDVAPETLLRQFAEAENVPENLLAVGMELLKETRR
jgi:hypothetical protein